MGKLTFKGGVHPASDRKELSKDLPIETAPLPEQVVLPLSQHIGAPAKAIVEPGDEVKKGQLIGEPGGFVSAGVHASISGTVEAIEPRPHPLGGKQPAIIISGDGEDSWVEGLPAERDTSEMTPDEIRERIASAGIVGLGGASFPAHVKLSPPEDKPVDTVIINGAECEPYLTCDYRQMLERPSDVLDGLRLMTKALGAERACVGIEDNKPEALAVMRDAADGTDIEVVEFETKYPQGQEHHVICAVTGREVPSGGLPMDVGACVHNVATAVAISEAVRNHKPLIERVLTVTGDGVEQPGNLLVRAGTSIAELASQRGVKEDVAKLILGGPMMGLAMYTFELPVLKATSGVLVMTEATLYEPRMCIRCGECVAHCPMRLIPSELSILCESKDFDAIAASDIMDCKLCGTCAYVCPARRPIVHQIKFGQAQAKAMKAAARE